ncbi:hypothetical protein B0H16DRAFT_1698856 [Mycena metata]|uniref:Uncharacterized protein n=1 Tax=Mycena metata TaxID=1033252 RepID=A0AAD7HN46_9AGAR|nr:hypothetical protein B0H16DRAFT_1698856 [Mycena metata]
MPPRKTAAKATSKKAPRKKVAEPKKTTTTSNKKAPASKKRAHSPDGECEPEVEAEAEVDPATPAKAPPRKRVKRSAAPSKEEPQASVGEVMEQSTTKPAHPALVGKFDIYAIELPFLAKAYLPTSASEPEFGALYDTILTYQAKSDFTARCVLPASKEDSDKEDDKPGRLSSAVLENPMEGMPWDIALVDLQRVESVLFLAKERKEFATPPRTNCGAGIEDRTVLEDSNCGVQSAGGVFRMQRAWTGDRGGENIEVFEGYLSFDVVYSGMYRRKGHGSGQKIGFSFWAVRARKGADGSEIGLAQA